MLLYSSEESLKGDKVIDIGQKVLNDGGVGFTGTLPEKMEAPSGEITSDKAAGLTNGLVDSSETTDDVHLPGFLSAAMVQGVGSYSKDPVSTHSTTTRSSVYFLDVDWSGSLKFLFVENPTKNYPWTGHVVKPFKPFDLDAMHKCAARLIINAFPVEVEEFLEGYQVEPGMIRPFKAARKLKGHHLAIRRPTARRAQKHRAKIQGGGFYDSGPISHGSYGAYGFEP